MILDMVRLNLITYMNVFSNPISNPKMNEPIEVDSKQNEVEVGDVFFRGLKHQKK